MTRRDWLAATRVSDGRATAPGGDLARVPALTCLFAGPSKPPVRFSRGTA